MESPPPYVEQGNPKLLQYDYNQPTPSFQPQPQQQQVVVIQPQMVPTYVYQPYPVSMTGAIVLSCFVFWCCGGIFGGIAFILAIIGSDASHSGDINGAVRLRNTSYGLSIAGIIITIIAVIVFVSYYSTHKY